MSQILLRIVIETFYLEDRHEQYSEEICNLHVPTICTRLSLAGGTSLFHWDG